MVKIIRIPNTSLDWGVLRKEQKAWMIYEGKGIKLNGRPKTKWKDELPI